MSSLIYEVLRDVEVFHSFDANKIVLYLYCHHGPRVWGLGGSVFEVRFIVWLVVTHLNDVLV
jgi:hypothetical protein